MTLLSKHLSFEAAIASNTANKLGIKNVPSPTELANLVQWGKNIYDPLVEHFGPLYLSSVFRSKVLNSHPSIGGSKTSGHVRGEAGDIDGDAPLGSTYKNVSNVEIFEFIRDNLQFDQLIAEFSQNGQPRWIHVGFRKYNRKQILIAMKNSKGETFYAAYTKKLFDSLYKSEKQRSKLILDKYQNLSDSESLNAFRAENASNLEEEINKE